MCKDLFETIDTTIRKERLYAEVGLIHSSVEPCAHRLLLATPESALLSFDIEGGKHFYDIEKEHPQIMK